MNFEPIGTYKGWQVKQHAETGWCCVPGINCYATSSLETAHAAVDRFHERMGLDDTGRFIPVDLSGFRGFGSWLIAEQFSLANIDTFRALVRAERLAHIGFCLPNAVTGDFKTLAEAYAWIATGKNVYADVKLESERAA